MTICMLLLCIPLKMNAINNDTKVASDEKNAVATENVNSASATQIEADLARLEEIKAMDFSTMTRAEKKAVRDELKEIKSDLNLNGQNTETAAVVPGGGIYLSAGALVLVILLLILLL